MAASDDPEHLLSRSTCLQLHQEPGSATGIPSGTKVQTQNVMESPRITDYWFAEEPDAWEFIDISILEDTPVVEEGAYDENIFQRNNPLVPICQEEPLEHAICSYLSAEPLSIPTVPSLSGSSGVGTPERTLTPLPCSHPVFASHENNADFLNVGESHRRRTSRSPHRLTDVAKGSRPLFNTLDGVSVHSVQGPFQSMQATRHHELQQWPSSSAACFMSTDQESPASLLQSQPMSTPPQIAGLVASTAELPTKESSSPSASRRSTTGSESQKHDLSETPKGTTDKRRRLNAKPSGTPREESSSGESGDATDKKPSPQPGKEARRLACPFLRRNPLSHKSCLNIKIKRIRDLKQHLRRAHYPPRFYCPVCLEEYASRNPWERHIKSRQCQPSAQKPRKNKNVVSKEAQDILSQRADRKQSDIEQYYTIWDGLFGRDTPRPHNPYLGGMVEETMNLVSGFWRSKASEIIPPLLEGRPAYAGKIKEIENLMLDLFDEVKIQFVHTSGEDTNGDSDSTLKQSRWLASTVAPNISNISSPSCPDHQSQDTLARTFPSGTPFPDQCPQASEFEWPGETYWVDTHGLFPQAEEDGFLGTDNGCLPFQNMEEQHTEMPSTENSWRSVCPPEVAIEY